MYYNWKRNKYISKDLSGVYYHSKTKTLIYHEPDELSPEYNIKDGTKLIGQDAFYMAENLQKIILPRSIQKIDSCAFFQCSSLKTIELNEGLTRIGDFAFQGCESLEIIKIPSTVNHLGTGIFKECSNLKCILIHPDNCYFQADNTFIYTKDKTRIVAYLKSEKSKTLVIPEGIEIISDAVFNGAKFNFIEIPSTIRKLGKAPFSNCTKLLALKVDDKNSYYQIIKDALVFKPNQLIAYPAGMSKTSYEIPENINCVGNRAFYNCIEIETLTLPESLEVIEESAFCFCDKLKDVNLPFKLRKIGKNAFSNTGNINFRIDEHHPHFRIIDGDIFEKRDDVYVKFLSSEDRIERPF